MTRIYVEPMVENVLRRDTHFMEFHIPSECSVKCFQCGASKRFPIVVTRKDADEMRRIIEELKKERNDRYALRYKIAELEHELKKLRGEVEK